MTDYSQYREQVSPEELYFGQAIAQSYDLGHVVGWPGEEIAKEAFYLLVQQSTSRIVQYRPLAWQADGKMMLYQCARKVLGKDTKNYPQQVGDCVSFGAKNAIEHLICVQQILGVAPSKFRPVFPPYLYGCGRVFVGKGRIKPSEDGSVGSWQAEAVQHYGAIASDEQGIPEYSGKIARQWGGQGPPKELVEIGKHYPVKSAAQMNSWQDLVGAVTNGYPCTIASNQGFTMEAGPDGFHSPKGKWGHQMCCLPQTLIKSRLTTNIEKINIGDTVLGHDGKLHKVTQKFVRQYIGDVIKIKPHGMLSLQITLNHPILVMTDDGYVPDGYTEHGVATVTKKKVVKYVNASDIRIGDYLVSPAYTIDENQKFDLPKWDMSGKGRNVPKDLFFDNDIAWLFGLYAADGTAEPGRKIKITLHEDELDIAARAVKAITKLGLKSRIVPVKNKKAIRVVVCSSVVANSFAQWFGKKKNKHLPEWIFDGWNLKEVIQGIFDGDGNYIQNRDNCRRIVNTSKSLIDQVQTILMINGEKPSVSIVKYSGKYSHWLPRYNIEWYINTEKAQHNKWYNNNLLLKVKEVTIEAYSGPVYNLEVEDCHTYVANGVAVHNCVIGVDGKYSSPYGIILNSWGDVHGHLKDFGTGEDLPIGCLRVHAEVIEGMIRQGDTFAYSHMDWFEEQAGIPEALFKLI